MRMLKITWLDLLGLITVAVVIVFLFSPVWAGGDCNGPGACTDDDVTVDTVVDTSNVVTMHGSKNRSLGLANAQGDVDIGDCIVTTQWNAVIFARQSWDYSVWCQANDIHLGGKPVRAAEARCQIPFFAKLFGDECVDAMTFAYAADMVLDAVPDKDEDDDRRDRDLEEVMTRLDLYDANRRSVARQAVTEQKRRNAYADRLEGKQ